MRLFILLLLSSFTAAAQPLYPFKDSAVVSEVSGLPAAEPFDTAHRWQKVNSPYIYLISDKDTYDHFGYDISMKFHDFDFANYHILGQQLCRQCLRVCNHQEGERACHRNRCTYGWVWYKRDNKKAFTEIPITAMPGHTGVPEGKGQFLWLRDTIMKADDDSVKARWYTTGHGDCHAHFKYALYTDKYHPVLLLKEWNHWGGCRAGGSFEHTIYFDMPKGYYNTFKNTILAEKLSNQ